MIVIITINRFYKDADISQNVFSKVGR